MGEIETIREALREATTAFYSMWAEADDEVLGDRCSNLNLQMRAALSALESLEQPTPPAECGCPDRDHWHHVCADLEPCPFCGPGNSIVSVYQDDLGYWKVGCGACGAHSGTRPKRDPQGRERVTASWNRRPERDALKQRVKDLEEGLRPFAAATGLGWGPSFQRAAELLPAKDDRGGRDVSPSDHRFDDGGVHTMDCPGCARARISPPAKESR